MRKLLIALAAGLAVVLPAAPAQAHNALAEATPKKDAVLKAVPAEIKLRFLQKLNPDYTTVVVTDAAKQKLAAEQPQIDGNTVTLALMSAPGNGTYTVSYQTVSLDGHAVKGSYRFTVDDPSAPIATTTLPSPEPTASAEAAATPASAAPPPATVAAEPVADEGGMGTPVLIALVGAILVLAALAGGFWWRSRRRS